jgi:hypothetical protein
VYKRIRGQLALARGEKGRGWCRNIKMLRREFVFPSLFRVGSADCSSSSIDVLPCLCFLYCLIWSPRMEFLWSTVRTNGGGAPR